MGEDRRGSSDMSKNDIFESTIEAPLLNDDDDDDVVEGAVNYKGRPIKHSESGRWVSASFIIGVEMAERFAYYGISSNLITYLTGQLGQSTATAAANVNVWSGTGSLLPLFGGFVADSFLGCYRTIVVASLLYILALCLLTLSAVFPSSKWINASNITSTMPPELQMITFFFSLYLIAIAQGMHKPCVQAFGANQFDKLDQEECKAKSSFFNWWCVCICVAITSTLVIVTYIQDNLSWGLGFGIPSLVMGFALLWFLLGTTTYRFHDSSAQNSSFEGIGRVFVRAARNWRTTSSAISVEVESQEVLLQLGHSQQFKFLNKALVEPDGSREDGKVCSVREVEDAKAVLRLFPIWFSCLVYGIVYSQSSTLFTKQGLTLDRSFGSRFEVPAASLQCFISVTIVVFISIYDRVLVPIARAITNEPSGITMLQRIGTGIFISLISMSIAALVERKRLETAQEYGLVDRPNATIPMSVVWLIPQYLLLGISESFTIVGLQEFFYDQVPSELKSTGLALYLSIMGIGGFLSSIFISTIEKITSADGHDGWFCDNLNKAHLDYFYWLLAGLSVVTLAAFLYFAKSYVYRRE